MRSPSADGLSFFDSLRFSPQAPFCPLFAQYGSIATTLRFVSPFSFVLDHLFPFAIAMPGALSLSAKQHFPTANRQEILPDCQPAKLR